MVKSYFLNLGLPLMVSITNFSEEASRGGMLFSTSSNVSAMTSSASFPTQYGQIDF